MSIKAHNSMDPWTCTGTLSAPSTNPKDKRTNAAPRSTVLNHLLCTNKYAGK